MNNHNLIMFKPKDDSYWIEKVNTILNNFEFIEVVDRVKSEAKLKIKCKVCNTSYVINACTLRKNTKEYCFKCKECKRIDKENQRQLRKIEQQNNIRQKQLNKPRIQKQMVFCDCGQLLPFGHRKCEKCKKEVLRTIDRRKENKRRSSIKNGEVDHDITLYRLYLRDGGICKICGKPCDYNDCSRADGIFRAYRDYPSIDHIKPLSKGGSDTWGNVRLAHIKCNSRKGNKYTPLSQK